MDGSSPAELTFGGRLKLAWRVFTDVEFARKLVTPAPAPAPAAPQARPAPAAAPAPAPAPERVHASGLAVLAALQREGRLLDFLQQDVTGFADEDVASAARVVHAGCRRVLQQSVDLEAAVAESEGSPITVKAGFDAGRIRLIGNVSGQPPFRGTVRHHGWVARTVRLPEISGALDPRVLAAAEVELA